MQAFLERDIFSHATNEKELSALLDKIKSYGVDDMDDFLDNVFFSQATNERELFTLLDKIKMHYNPLARSATS
eukprot:7170162-Prymnesium_polylepis.1